MLARLYATSSLGRSVPIPRIISSTHRRPFLAVPPSAAMLVLQFDEPVTLERASEDCGIFMAAGDADLGRSSLDDAVRELLDARCPGDRTSADTAELLQLRHTHFWARFPIQDAIPAA